MASGIDFPQAYQKAEKAYMQGKYQDAAAIIDELAAEYPEDPSVLLLRGHIYCYGMQQYGIAQDQYQKVLAVTSETEFVDYANNGIDYTAQFTNGQGNGHAEDLVFDDPEDSQTFFDQGAGEPNPLGDSQEGMLEGAPDPADISLSESDLAADDPFAAALNEPELLADDSFLADADELADPFSEDAENPFLVDEPRASGSSDVDAEMADSPFGNLESDDFDEKTSPPADNPFDAPGSENATVDFFSAADMDLGEEFDDDFDQSFGDSTEQTLFTASDSTSNPLGEDNWPPEALDQEDRTVFGADPNLDLSAAPELEAEVPGTGLAEDVSELDDAALPDYSNNGTVVADSLESEQSGSNVDFLDEFSEFDDLGSLPDFELSDSSAGFTSPSVGPSGLSSTDDDIEQDIGASAFDLSDVNDQTAIGEEDVFSLSGGNESLPVFAAGETAALEDVSVEQLKWRFPARRRPWVIAIANPAGTGPPGRSMHSACGNRNPWLSPKGPTRSVHLRRPITAIVSGARSAAGT